MKINFKADWQLLSKRAKIFYLIFSLLNVWLLIILLGPAEAGFFPSLIFFVFWQAAIWIYYMFRYKMRKKIKGGEWIDAGMFAIIAATIIRTLFIEAYQIPTSSMEKSLLVGDFLFVSKVNYGPRIPITPIAFPFVHHTMPLVGGKAYSEALKLPYYRLFGFQDIKRNDVVVFNYPGDEGRPVDKKENYIKRCLAIGGDSFKIVDGNLFVNNKLVENPPHAQRSYELIATKSIASRTFEDMGIYNTQVMGGEGLYKIHTTEENAAKLKAMSIVKSVEPLSQDKIEDPNIFPNITELRWTVDNFGSIYVPRKGDIVQLDSFTYSLYEKVIREYENNPDFTVRGGKYYLGGKEITQYEFKMNYYFMIGDNRHQSADSRYWGFVPDDHVVGKALFIWMSMDAQRKGLSRIRWNRIFKGIH